MARTLKITAVSAVAIAALLYGLLESGQNRRASRALEALPGTARAVLRLDTGALRRTGAARTLLGAFVADEQLSEIETACGIDPWSALGELTLWLRGSAEQPFQSTGLMLRGRTIDASALAGCHRLLVEKRGGSVVRLEAPSGPVLASEDRRSAIAILDDRRVITGSVRTVAEAMAVRRGLLPSLAERAPIAELWPRVSRNAALAAVVDPPEHWKAALERITTFGDEGSALEGVEALALAVPAGSERTIHLLIDLVDAATAQQDAELIRAWAEAPPEGIEPPWDEVLRSARVQVAERQIDVFLNVSSLSERP